MGFDNECILNIQSLAGEYFCPVCRLLVYPNEALQSQCTHLYCKPCLTYVVSTTRACPYDGYLVTEAYSKPLIESNKSLADTIGKIAVHCLYHRSGCTWQGPLNDCTSHCSGCAFGDSPVVCNRCGIQIVHRQVQEHAQNCPGVQPQAQKPEGATDTSASSTGATANQDQAVVVTSQSLTSQTTTTATPSQDPNVKTDSSSQVQSVVQGAGLTAEQWYQQQQQYQQYYQQYPGFDPYQQHYQQYYPQQQAAIAQYQQPHLQAHVPPTTGQHQHQVYMQPQTQSQSQLQPQQQAQLQLQPQAPHFQNPQPQNLVQINPQQQQQQQHPTVPPHSEIQSQTYPPAHGNLYPQPQTQPHGQSISQFHTQQAQVPQYQQSHPQIQQSQPQIHPQIQTQSQHPFQSQSLAQVQPQGQLQHHTQVSSPQVNQALNANVQVQAQNPPAHAVSGHQSYTQPQPQQVQTGTSQQFPAYVPPQAMHLAQSHNPVQLQAQFPQQSVLTRPPSQSALSSQQQPALLPSLGSVQNVASTQQPIHPHSQQPGHFVNQRPVMQQVQQVVPQQYYQQPMAAPSQLRPQGQSHSFIQHPYPQQLQNVTQLHGSHIGQSQNVVERHLMPNHGVQSQPYAQPSTGVQVRSVYPGANQQNILATNDQGKLHPEQLFGDKIFHKGLVQQVAEVSSEKAAKATNVVAHGSEVKSVKSETGMKSLGNEHKSSVEYKSKKPESHLFENIEPKLKPFAKKDQELENSTVKEEVVVGSHPKISSQEVEFLEEQARELQKGAIGISAEGPVAASAASTSNHRGSHLVTTSDQGRQQPLPSHYGPSVLPQPPGAPPFAPHQVQGLGYPPTHFKPLGVPGQPLHPPEHVQPPGGVPDLGSAESFGRESYSQGHAGTPSLGPPPQGAAGSHGGVMPLYGPEGQKSSQHSTNGLEAEIFSNQRPNYTDSRQSDPNNMSVNGTLGFVSVSALESRDERFKPLPDEHAFRHVLDHRFPSRGQFEDDLKQFPRLPSPDADHVLKFRDPSSRPFDKGHHGSKYDNGLKSDSVMGSVPSKFLSPYHGGASLRSNDAWERPVGLREGTRRMESIHGHPDFFGPGPAFGRHHMDALAPRSPARAQPGIPSRGFGGSDLDNINNGRDMRRFGEPLGNSFHEGRFLEGRGGRPMGEHFRNDLIGQDNLPGNIRRVEHLGPSNMQWHLHMGEPAGFGAHPHHVRRGEMASPRMFEPFGGGNMSSHPRFGEPGFRSSFSLHGFPISDGSYTAEVEFSNLRKRKAMSNGWCRICKVDCDTIEGLDLHSQTIEHQKKAMDMVRSIKQNAKKHKLTSGEHSSPRDTSKLKSTRSEGGGKKN